MNASPAGTHYVRTTMRTHRHADGSLLRDADEMPTQRLYTLRRLLKGKAPPLVFDEATPLDAVERALLASPSSRAMDDEHVEHVLVVTSAGELLGVVSRQDIERHDHERRGATEARAR